MKKKHLAYTLGFLCAFLSISYINTNINKQTKSVNASNGNDDYYSYIDNSRINIAPIGHGINFVEGSSTKIEASNVDPYVDILDQDFLKQAYRDYGRPWDTPRCEEFSRVSDSVESLIKETSQNYGSKVTGGIKYGPAAVELSTEFGISFDDRFSSSLSQLLYYGKYTSVIGVWGLGTNKQLYKENLDDGYVNAVTKLVTSDVNDEKITAFFETYGTHLLTKGTYGGVYEAYYKCFSNQIDFYQKSKEYLKSAIDGKVIYSGATISAGASSEYSITNEINGNASQVEESITCKSTGGEPFVAFSFSGIAAKLDSWLKSVSGKPALVSTDEALPLWEILPSNIDNDMYAERLKKCFERYQDLKISQILTKGQGMAMGANKVYDKFEVPGSREKNISVGYDRSVDGWTIAEMFLLSLFGASDPSLFDYYNYDKKAEADVSIDLSNIDHASLGLLERLSFDTANVTIKLQAREIRNCTECIRLYSYKSNVPGEKFSNANLIGEKTFNAGSSFAFSTVTFENIPIKDLLEYNKIFICLDVTNDSNNSSKGEWEANTISVSVEYLKAKRVEFKTEDWGFNQQYYFENNAIGTNKNKSFVKNGIKYDTERLRCGTIPNEKSEESYVVLSPKRKNAGKAYFEITSRVPIWKVKYDIAKWRLDDGLDASSNCTAIVETCDFYGNWTLDTDLLNDRNLNGIGFGNGFLQLCTNTDTLIYGIRFVTTAPATGDKNLARLAIKNIAFEYNYGGYDY